MFDLLGQVRASIDAALRTVVWGVIAAASAVVGFMFLIVAATIWLATRYDILTACIVMGLVFVIIALVATLVIVLMRRRADQRAQQRRARLGAQWWLDPSLLASGVQVTRMLGSRRATTLLVLAMASGFLLSAMRSRPSDSPERRGA